MSGLGEQLTQTIEQKGLKNMTELELYKFVQGKEIDWRGEELLLWINFYDLGEFTKLIGFDYLSEGGEEASLQHDCICIDIVCICENHEINPENLLPKIN